ncbi:MAG TPA: carboxypeptidase-like regulatory domain-containing protein [Cyclobacteriaceae bacterium]
MTVKNFAKLSLFTILLLVVSAAYSQKTTRVIVVDSITFQPLPAVLVQVKNSKKNLLVDPSGIFTINTKRTDTLVLSHVGYISAVVPLFFEEDAILIRMREKVTLLKEVTITSRKLYPNEINPRKSTPPRTPTLVESLAAPWEYFNKREKEKRKVAKLMQENDRIRTFIEVVTDLSVKEELMQQHDVSEEAYYDILVKFNQQKFQVIYSNDADKIITALHDFFEKSK